MCKMSTVAMILWCDLASYNLLQNPVCVCVCLCMLLGGEI